MRDSATLLGTASAIAALGIAACGPTGNETFDPEAARESARGRDVVLVTLDTTRFDHLGAYGYDRETSPVIDRFAAEGVRFDVAYAVAPTTLPSHGSILTGLDPPRHGVRNNGTYRLPESARTLAEILGDAGYETAAFVSAFVLDRRFGLAQGFETYDDDLSEGFHESRFHIRTRPAATTATRAIGWLEQRSSAKPFFLWVHFFDPHAPYGPPPSHRGLFGNEPVDLYDAEIRAMDDAVGLLADAMAERGRDPVWVVLADHGESLSAHGETYHGVFLYEETARIPWVLYGPGVFPAQVSKVAASQVDLVPTLLDLLDLPVPAELSGRSLLSALAGRDTGRAAYVESLLPYENYGWAPLFALVQDGWKLIEAPLPELYDLTADPGERDNRIEQQTERAAAMRRHLAQRRQAKTAAERLTPDESSLASLHALGYATGSGAPQPADELRDPKEMIDIPAKLEEARALLRNLQSPRADPLRALQILAGVVERNPGNREALWMLGYEGLRAVQLRPNDPHREQLLALSSRAFDVYAERMPGEPDAQFGYGMIALARGDDDDARRHFESALATHPNHEASAHNLRQLERQEGRGDALPPSPP